MRYLTLLMLIMTIYTNKLQAETQQEIVNDTLWTCMPQIDGTYSGFFAYSTQHNLFYTITRSSPKKHAYLSSYSLDDAREVTRKYFDSTLFKDVFQNIFCGIYYELEDKLIVNVKDSLYFLDPVTLDIVRKVKLPPYIKDGEEINGYNTALGLPGTYKTNKYVIINIIDNQTNRTITAPIYDIERNEYLNNQFSTADWYLTWYFNEDASLLTSRRSTGFTIYKTSDWSELYSKSSELVYDSTKWEQRWLLYSPSVGGIAYSPDKSRMAFSIRKETVLDKFINTIEIFNLNTLEFEESFQLEYTGGFTLHFVDNETLIMCKRQNPKEPSIFLYKLNTNGNLVQFPWQGKSPQTQSYVSFSSYISLDNNDILCLRPSPLRLDVRPELVLNVEESHPTLYPNPSNGLVNIQLNSISTGNTNWQLINTSGNIILNGNQLLHTGINQFTINISGVPIGQYILSFTGAVNTTYNIIKE